MIALISYTIQSYFESITYAFNKKVIFYIFLLLILGGASAFYVFTFIWNESDSIFKTLLGQFSWFETNGFLTTAMTWIVKLFGTAFILILYRYIFFIVCSPILSLISEAVEKEYFKRNNLFLSTESISIFSSIGRSILMNGRNFIIEIAICTVLFLLSFIPLLGIIFSALSFLVSSYFAGVSNFDFSVERYYKYSTSLRWYAAHRLHVMGQGIVYMLFFWIPIIGWVLIPIWSTIASTIHYCKIAEGNK